MPNERTPRQPARVYLRPARENKTPSECVVSALLSLGERAGPTSHEDLPVRLIFTYHIAVPTDPVLRRLLGWGDAQDTTEGRTNTVIRASLMRRVCTEHNVAPVHCVLQDGVFRVEANLRVPLTDAEYDRLLRVFQSRTTRYGTFAPLETLVQVPRELGSVEMLYVQLQLVNVEAVRVRSLRDQPILAEAVADVPDEPNSARPRAQRSRSAIRYTPNPPLPESPWTTPEHDALVREVLGRNLREREREQVLTSWVGDEAGVRVADTHALRGTSVYARGADTRTQRGRGEKKKGARKSQPAEPVFPGKPGRRKLVFDD